MRRNFASLVLVLVMGAPWAWGQATRPLIDESPYENLPLPMRHVATTQATSSSASTGGSADVFNTKRMILALAIVLLAIFVSHRVWKKLGLPGGSGRLSGALQVVSRLSVAPKQQILLVRVGKRLVLVGNSGTQMNPLCEIGDPDEAAALLGEVASQRDESASVAFNAVLGGEEKRFEEESIAAASSGDEETEAEEDEAIASTRAELSGLAEKVRSLSNQFRRA
jgi:flagellar biogenesis protein FliO